MRFHTAWAGSGRLPMFTYGRFLPVVKGRNRPRAAGGDKQTSARSGHTVITLQPRRSVSDTGAL